MERTVFSVCLTLCLFVTFMTSVKASTSSLVLHNAQNVAVGSYSQYNCTSSGNGVDPEIQWKIRRLNSATSLWEDAVSNSALSSSYVSGTSNPNDGTVTSSVTFLVENAYFLTSHRLYCYAYDNGAVSLNIYTPLSQTTATLGQSCSGATTCGSAFSTCSSNTCVCSTGYYDDNGLNTQGGSCRPKVGLGQTCTAGIDASCSTQYAQCSPTSPYTCQCAGGYVASGSTCIISSAGYNEQCVSPIRTCLNNLVCASNGVCACPSGTVYSSSQQSCISNTAGINDSCVNPTRSCPSNAFCNGATCQCNSGYVYSSSQGGCVASSAGINDVCTNPTRTCPTNANCDSGTSRCQCNTGYITSGNTCQLPGIGQTCTVSVGCQSTTSGSSSVSLQCINQQCACPNNYYNLNNICYLKSNLGAGCNSAASDSCATAFASCTGSPTSTCQCNSGYVIYGNTCILDTSSQSCPASSQVPSVTAGTSNPATSTPSVTVAKTCYAVSLYNTQVMPCSGTGSLQSARWIKLPSTIISPGTGSYGAFINGDIANPNLTISNAQASFAGSYICQLCHAANFVRCTNSSAVSVYILGSQITAVSLSASPSTSPVKGSQVTMTCEVTPSGVADTYTFYKGGSQVSTGSSSTYTLAFAQASHSGQYTCTASNTYGSVTSSGVTFNVQYAPEFSLSGGGNTQTIEWNFDNGDLTLSCDMTANPAISTYYFYDGNGNTLFTSTTSNTYSVSSSLGYQTYSCRAENNIAMSGNLYFQVVEESAPNTGASTENTGIGTGTIAAIVLGIIFFLLLLIIIIVCCCNYGWCRKEKKVEPQPPPPAAKPYIPSVSTDFEEPRYTTPRYHLKPAKSAGPIISMFDDGYEQPRGYQLPALDTQYLYADEAPKKKKKKRRRRHHEHRESSPRRHDYNPEPAPLPPSDEDLVVVPGKQNYFE